MARYPRRASSRSHRSTALNAVATAAARDAVKEIEKSGFRVYPATRADLKSTLKKSIQSGTLADADQVQLAAAALASAAAQQAQQTQTRSVRPFHLKAGFKGLAAVGNCPPHRCLFRSVVEQQENVARKVPLFGDVLSALRGQF